MNVSRRRLLQLSALSAAVSAVAQTKTSKPEAKHEEKTSDYHLLSDVMVEMRDGVKLATDIYLPLQGDSFPVVIERTPYGKTKHSRSEITLDGRKISRAEVAAAFTRLGMAFVYQDCRGRYKSEGKFIKYINEPEDGYDTYAWVRKQSWCNGKLGSMGLSYASHTQLAAACLNPPGLVTMALDSGGFANSYENGTRQGGTFEMKQVTWALNNAKVSPLALENPLVKTALEQEDVIQWFKMMPWKKGHSPLRHHPEYEDYLFEQWQKGEFTDYWKSPGIYAAGYYKTLPDIPVLFLSSWYDAYVWSTLENYAAFTKSPRKAKSHLIMGSWLHGDRTLRYSGDVDFGDKAPIDGNLDKGWLEYRLEWFAHQFGLTQGALKKPAVSLFFMGGGSGKKTKEGRLEHGGHWHFAEQYPLPDTKTQRFYLRQNMSLSKDKDQEKVLLAYQSDPKNPVPTIGGSITSGKPVMVGGAFDQVERPDFFGTRGDNLPLSARNDILVFETEPLEEDLVLAGDVKIKLYIRSDAPDTDFTAKLVDVYPASEDYPKGFAMNITDGIFRCRYRESNTKPKMLNPKEIVEIEIQPFASCNIFKKGHKLRLDIASSNFPHFDVNPQTGEPEGMARMSQIARNEVFVGGKYSSYLEIAVVTLPSS